MNWRRRSPFRMLKGTLALVGLSLSLGACEKDVTYSYFTVSVKIEESAPAAYLDTINSCGVNVTGADTGFASLPCARGTVVKHDMGTIDWSTSAPSGNVVFTVTLKDVAGNEIGKGDSPMVAINPGGTNQTQVLIQPIMKADAAPPTD